MSWQDFVSMRPFHSIYPFLALALASVCISSNANAALIINALQVGDDVEIRATGSLVLPVYADTNGAWGSLIDPSIGTLCMPSSSTNRLDNYFYLLSGGPTSFGTGGQVIASSSAGNYPVCMLRAYDVLGNVIGIQIGVPNYYLSGQQIDSYAIYLSKTLDSLGLSSSSGLIAQWALGTDSVSFYAGPTPGPITATTAASPVPFLGFAFAFRLSRRLRATIRRAK
jgi:hypothetical protein